MISCSYSSETSLRFASNKPLGTDAENVEELTKLNTSTFALSKFFGDTVCTLSYNFGTWVCFWQCTVVRTWVLHQLVKWPQDINTKQ